MGNTWEVLAWAKNDDPGDPGPGYGQDFYFVQVYAGESRRAALKAATAAKRDHGMVKIEWRG
jgi:hypothetical protein